MKRSRFSEEQIIGILKEHQARLGAKDLCRKHGISDATFYKWRSKYGGMEERIPRPSVLISISKINAANVFVVTRAEAMFNQGVRMSTSPSQCHQ